MFPFISAYPYLNMMGMGQLGRRTPSPSPWDETLPRFGGPLSTSGQSPWDLNPTLGTSQERPRREGFLSRPGVGQGLTALGTSLLEAAPRGDFSGGLARGAAGFGDALAQGAEQRRREEIEAREEERRVAADARTEEQERDRNRSADQQFERGNAELEAWREEQDRGRESRARTGKSAEQMVAEIEQLAAGNPKDPKLQVMARRAAGYALGEESDLNRLATLHEQMTEQAFFDQDVDRKTDAQIRGKRRMYEEGLEVNPVEESRRDNARADAQLGISREHLAISRQNADREKEGLTDLQAYDRLEKKVQAKLDQRVQAKRESQGREPTPRELAEWRQQAMTEAMSEMQQRMNQVYQFNAAGDPIR